MTDAFANLRFAEPLALGLLLLIPLLAWWRGGPGRPAALRFPSTRLAATVARMADRGRGRWLPSLRDLALALLVVALARPQAGRTFLEETTSGVDILLVLDLSLSMWAHDFEHEGELSDRLTVVKSVVDDFIEARPADRLGLVAFGAAPYLVSPLTLNHGWIRQNLERLRLGSIDGTSTAIGSALALATNRLRDLEAKSRVVVLLSDGENNSGTIPPATAAEAAATFGVRVYTVGVGRSGVVPFPVLGPDNQPRTDARGRMLLQRQRTNVDFADLETIAQKTGGRFFQATDTAGLRDIYAEIDRLERTERRQRRHVLYRELFAWPLGLGLAVLALELARRSVRGRLP